jgi:preprotein translocase subunit YajC
MRVIAGVIAIGAPLSAKWILGPLVVFSFAQFFLWRQQKRARKKFATIW